MQTTATPTGEHELAGNDLGPLAWVLDELKKSLDGATKAMRRFVRDAELARGSDLAALDASQLRIARQQLHQAVGALEMVGFSVPAKVMRVMESLAQKFVQRPELCSDDATVKMERASFALAEYLEGVLKGKSASPVALFPQYRDVLELVGGEKVHPSDLWSIEWAWIETSFANAVAPLPPSPNVRAQLDQSVLRLVKTDDIASAAHLRDLSLGLAAGQSKLESKVFWQICAAFFEAKAKRLFVGDVYSKRSASRVLMQYASIARGDFSVSDRLAQDLLFFCSQAMPAKPSDAPVLAAVRNSYHLTNVKSVNYNVPQFGRYDPAVLLQARKRIATATESWSALAGGDTNRLKVVSDQFGAVSYSILKLHPESNDLARALVHAVEQSSRSGEPPSTPVAMEVATAVLYLEAAYDDLDPTDTTMTARSFRLAQRLDQVTKGGQSEPLEGWMEELYRRVSDRQTMGSVVDELRTSLGEIEKSLDQYFRNPIDKVPLHEVPSQLAQMRGVFSVLGLDQASLATLRMRDSVEKLLIEPITPANPGTAGFEKLGSSLGALGFLIDMLGYQRAMAKNLFVYDEIAGEFKPVMGRVKPAVPSKPILAAPALAEAPTSQAASLDALDTQALAISTVSMQAADAPANEVSSFAALADSFKLPSIEPALVTAFSPSVSPSLVPSITPSVSPQVPPIMAPVSYNVDAVPKDTTIASSTLTLPSSTTSQVISVPSSVGSNSGDSDEDTEIRDIFLEEATEVVQNGMAAITALSADPSNLGEQTTLRRAFHTLKGSSRMVGLTEFGEAAWSMEQLLNAWLAEQKPANQALTSLSAKAIAGLGLWVGHIAVRTDGDWSSQSFRVAADALRLENRVVELKFPGSEDFDGDTLTAESSGEMFGASSSSDTIASELPEPLNAEAVDNSVSIFGTVSDAPISILPEFEATSMFDVLAKSPSEKASSSEEAGQSDNLRLDDLDFSAPSKSADFENTNFLESRFGKSAAAPLEFAPSRIDSAELPVNFSTFSPPTAKEVPLAVNFAAVQPVVEPPANSVLPIFDDSRLMPGEQDESIKVIGSLRIGIPLYNVYLNEADEWSRRLLTELNEWALELHQPVPSSSVALAHSLAGSSATVGFLALSDIARALESALQHVRLHRQSDAAYAQVFTDSAEDIRRLLHQFAAGFLKEPDAYLLDALKAILETEFAASPDGSLDDLDFSAPAETQPQELQALDFMQPQVAPDLVPAPLDVQAPTVLELAAQEASAHDQLVKDLKEQTAQKEQSEQIEQRQVADTMAVPLEQELISVETEPSFSVSVAPVAVAAATLTATTFASAVTSPALPAATLDITPERMVIGSDDDDIDATDALDADLFPIFEEEALELLPQLGGALRQWSERPDNLSARGEVLRVLHTLKGSARLAGALRLGEMTHRMESSIEQLGSEDLNAAQVEPLLARFDGLLSNFDGLRNEPDQAFSLPEAGDAVLALDDPTLPGAAQVDSPSVSPIATHQVRLASQAAAPTPIRQMGNQSIRVRSQLLDRLVNQAGEVMITRSRLEARLDQMRSSMVDLSGNLERLRQQLREIEVQSESQMQSRMALAKETAQQFDPLEFDRFTRVQELTRIMAESVNDVATVQRNLQRTVEGTEDDLIAQGRQARGLQRDLLRTRMVEFEAISERLYGVVRQAAKETGKQVKLDITGGSMDMDRGVLDRMAPAFEHLLRNSVAHGIENPEARLAAGKPAAGTITIALQHQSNEVSVNFSDDGAGLDLPRIRRKAFESGVVSDAHALSDADAANLIFLPGFSTAASVTEMSGRGIGMDVVRSEMNALGGRIETSSVSGAGTRFNLVLPLTTAVTQVVLLRLGDLVVGVPANLIEIVRRVPAKDLEGAYLSNEFTHGGETIPFYWAGALLQASSHSNEMIAKNLPVSVFRSAGQRVAAHVDEVLGNQEVVVKNLGPQLSRLPGLTGMSVLASGAVILIYNPVALASVYGEQARALRLTATSANNSDAGAGSSQDPNALQVMPPMMAGVTQVPLIMVVDDSITVRRVTQRLLKREGYRVVMAADGLQALERLQDERPTLVLSDIEMPRMDGFDLARNIRGDAKLHDLPIIMITSRIAEKHREHARELGVDHYLGKPYAEDELLRLVRQYCAAAVEA
jgi:chemosensory pili system protein ChpA (sensor histidine kinase/response regulator)